MPSRYMGMEHGAQDSNRQDAGNGTPADWRPHRGSRQRSRPLLVTGLTLSLLAAIWFAAVPNLGPIGGCRINADESAAIATLRNLASAQAQFRAVVAVDRDGNGEGEFGYFAELAAAVALPGRPADERLQPPVLSAAFGKVRHGCVLRSGYLYRIYLPGPGGAWLPEASRGGRIAQGMEPVAADPRWLAYAWPDNQRGSRRGRRMFMCDQSGDVSAAGAAGDEDPLDNGVHARLTGFRFDGARWHRAANTVDVFGDLWAFVN